MHLGISAIEIQLQKRLVYPYKWDRKQNNSFDNMTNYVYQITDFDDLLIQTKARFESNLNYSYPK